MPQTPSTASTPSVASDTAPTAPRPAAPQALLDAIKAGNTALKPTVTTNHSKKMDNDPTSLRNQLNPIRAAVVGSPSEQSEYEDNNDDENDPLFGEVQVPVQPPKAQVASRKEQPAPSPNPTFKARKQEEIDQRTALYAAKPENNQGSQDEWETD